MYYKVDQKVNRLSMHAWSSKYDLLVEFLGYHGHYNSNAMHIKMPYIVYSLDLDVIIEYMLNIPTFAKINFVSCKIGYVLYLGANEYNNITSLCRTSNAFQSK